MPARVSYVPAPTGWVELDRKSGIHTSEPWALQYNLQEATFALSLVVQFSVLAVSIAAFLQWDTTPAPLQIVLVMETISSAFMRRRPCCARRTVPSAHAGYCWPRAKKAGPRAGSLAAARTGALRMLEFARIRERGALFAGWVCCKHPDRVGCRGYLYPDSDPRKRLVVPRARAASRTCPGHVSDYSGRKGRAQRAGVRPPPAGAPGSLCEQLYGYSAVIQ